jgi:response regulator RpfG family c-di-GMP phosphodiesterase
MVVDNKNVMLVLCRKVISGLLIEAIQKRTEITAFGVYEFNKAKNMAMVRQPKIALVEIPERHGTPAQDALDICEEIKEVSPGCKVMLICPENDEESVRACLKAVKERKINDFLFYDSSVDYLVAKLESLLPV